MKALRNPHLLSLLLAGPALALSEVPSPAVQPPAAPLRKIGQIPAGTAGDFRARLIARTRAGDQAPVEINEAGDVFVASDFEGIVTFYAENGVTLATFDVKPTADTKIAYAFHEAVRAPMVPITAPPPLPAQVRPSRPSCKRGARRAARFPGSRRR